MTTLDPRIGPLQIVADSIMDPLRRDEDREEILRGWHDVACHADSIAVRLSAADCELVRRTLLQYLKEGPHNPNRYFYRVTLALDTSL
jgi:hypothetical protein